MTSRLSSPRWTETFRKVGGGLGAVVTFSTMESGGGLDQYRTEKNSLELWISILVLFLLGVAASRHISYYDNDPHPRPIVSRTQEHRICAELCMAGLGGEPCGDDCLDVIPQGLPVGTQSDGGRPQVDCTRKDACPLLCANRLGYPLCGCNYTQIAAPFFRVDFPQVCAHFCTQYDYQIYGCDECQSYKNATSSEVKGTVGITPGRSARMVYDWNSWCVQMCQAGDGGSACYCDLLPLALKV